MKNLNQVYQPPVWFRLLAVFGLVMTIGLAVIGWLAFTLEGARLGLYLLIVWLVIALIWVRYLIVWSRAIVLQKEGIIYRQFKRETAVPYQDITAVTLKGNQITISTRNHSYKFQAHPFRQADLYRQLEQRVPALHTAVQQQQNSPLPLIIHPPRLTPFLTFSGIFALGLFAFAVIIYTVFYQTWEASDWLLVILFSISGLACFAASIIFLTDYVWQYTFDDHLITVRHIVRTRHYDPQTITRMEITSEERTVRGIRRTFYALKISFAGNQTLKIAPRSFSDSFGLEQKYEQQDLVKLLNQLRRHYEHSSSPSPR